MQSIYIAIIHLRQPASPVVRTMIEPMLRLVRGVLAVQFEPQESIITVEFDGEETSLADIVRIIEDLGTPVSGVAQRRTGALGAA